MLKKYVSIRATTLSEITIAVLVSRGGFRVDEGNSILALKATFEPMLIKDNVMVIRQVSVVAFAGTCSVGWT